MCILWLGVLFTAPVHALLKNLLIFDINLYGEQNSHSKGIRANFSKKITNPSNLVFFGTVPTPLFPEPFESVNTYVHFHPLLKIIF